MDHKRVLVWAEGHLERLEESIKAFLLEKNPYPVVTDYDYATGEYVVRLRVRPDAPQPDRWVFMIGDAVHNMRVALDYLAFAVVTKYSPGADERQIAFPICDDAAKYPSIEGRCLAGAPDQAKLFIERMQPYHRHHAPGVEPLFLLDALENVHKHRRALAAGPAVTNAGYAGFTGNLAIRPLGLPSGPLEDLTEMFRYTFLDPSNARSDVQFKVITHICFSREGPAGGLVVLTTLKRIRDHIRDDIFPWLNALL